mmetsp:Transcript_13113/g.26749  ORF Transcript_13113/g.26749 Transcript_13113/m.26749 type:complete len:337 (-) Transcript_13113:21-1031(-)
MKLMLGFVISLLLYPLVIAEPSTLDLDSYLNNCVDKGSTVMEATSKRAKRRLRRKKCKGSSAGDSGTDGDGSDFSTHAGLACVPKSVWLSLTPSSFTKEAIQTLKDSGMDLANNKKVADGPKWDPDKSTASILKLKGGDEAMSADCSDIYVWTGTFAPPCTGADLPAIRTRGVIPMSAKSVAELLMDSSKVKVYNKMSLGRTDVKLFQAGIDSKSKQWGEGETKIVRNKTKPPMTSKTMVFTTLMHARKLTDDSYLVVSRAVNCDEGEEAQGEKTIKSEIMLGVNILRPLSDSSCELSSVTHVNSPLVPGMMAKTVGIKGAVDFIKDLRSLGKTKP